MAVFTASTLYRCVSDDLAEQGLFESPVFGYPDGTVREVAAARLLESVLKKFPDNVAPDADRLALEKFRQVNSECLEWKLSDSRSLVEDVILGEVRECLYRFWFKGEAPGTSLVEDPSTLLSSAYMGPGASMGASGTDFYSKLFAGRITCTSPILYKLYSGWVKGYPLWAESEETRFAHAGQPLLVDHNLLSFVPKDNRVSRVICTEPSLNMYYQLGLKGVLESRIRSFFGIDFASQQEINRLLAKRSSLDDRLSTIDLSSASDSVSSKMLHWLLPKPFYGLLMLLRSKNTRLPSGEIVPLGMISSMGNGFTFPLQTLIFAAVLRAVYKVMGVIPVPPPRGADLCNYAVYGDDIICCRETAGMVIRTLQLLGFNVNKEKSFVEGPFKESCGLDAYRGHDVRGVYLKEVSRLTPHVMFNRLVDWSAKTGLCLPSTFRYLLSCGEYLPVPLWESDAAGFKIPLRYWRNKVTDHNGSFVYTKLDPIPSLLRFKPEGSVIVPRGGKRRIYNSSAHYLCAIGGYITSDTISLRPMKDDVIRYRRRKALAPNWEVPSPEYLCHRRPHFSRKGRVGGTAEAVSDPMDRREAVYDSIFG